MYIVCLYETCRQTTFVSDQTPTCPTDLTSTYCRSKVSLPAVVAVVCRTWNRIGEISLQSDYGSCRSCVHQTQGHTQSREFTLTSELSVYSWQYSWGRQETGRQREGGGNADCSQDYPLCISRLWFTCHMANMFLSVVYDLNTLFGFEVTVWLDLVWGLVQSFGFVFRKTVGDFKRLYIFKHYVGWT